MNLTHFKDPQCSSIAVDEFSLYNANWSVIEAVLERQEAVLYVSQVLLLKGVCVWCECVLYVSGPEIVSVCVWLLFNHSRIFLPATCASCVCTDGVNNEPEILCSFQTNKRCKQSLMFFFFYCSCCCPSTAPCSGPSHRIIRSSYLDLAHVLMPDALPDITLPFYPGLGLALKVNPSVPGLVSYTSHGGEVRC